MRLDATGKTGPKPPPGIRVWDTDTGEEVRKVVWIDWDPVTGIGELLAYFVGPDGKEVGSVEQDGKLYFKTYTAKGRFRIGQGAPGGASGNGGAADLGSLVGRSSCALCPSPLTLAGDDLCAKCRARERGQKNRLGLDPGDDPTRPHKCCRCSRQAVHQVGDEVEASPVVLPAGRFRQFGYAKVAYGRAATVGRRWYCEFCYLGPRILDPNGEIIREIDDDPIRPQ